MLKSTENKGFHLTFQNGYTISVQFGRGNYCMNNMMGALPPHYMAENYFEEID